MTFKVYGNRVVFDQNRMFLRNAVKMAVGTWGIKKSPLGAQNYLDFGDDIDGTPFQQVGPFEAEFASNFSLAHVGAMNLPFKAFNLGIDDATKFSILRTGQCRFRNRFIGTEDMIQVLNSSRSVIERIKTDNDYRVVTSVIWLESCVVTTDKLHDVDVDGDFSLGLGGGGAKTATKAKVKGSKKPGFSISIVGDDSMSSHRKVTFDYGKDTVMAYGLHKPIWDFTNKKKRENVVDLRPDWQGLQ